MIVTYGWETGSEFSQGKRTYAVAEERRWSARRRHRQSSASAVWLGKPMSHTQRPPHTSARSQYGSLDQTMSTPARKSDTSLFDWKIFCNRDYIIAKIQVGTYSQLSRARFIDFVSDVSAKWAHYMEALYDIYATTSPPKTLRTSVSAAA